MIDRATKITLIAIAAGLWANALMPILTPKSARAQDDNSDAISSMATDLSNMASDIHDIYQGSCPNDTVCP